MKALVKGVRSVVGLCDPAAAELKTRGNTINHIHKGSVGLPSSTMSSLRIVGGIELPFGAEIPPCTDSFRTAFAGRREQLFYGSYLG